MSDPFTDAGGAPSAEAFLPRHIRGYIILGPLVLSLLGDLSIIGICAFVYRLQKDLLAPTHMKLFLGMIASNVVTTLSMFGFYFAPAGSLWCSASGFGFSAGMAGDYSSSMIIAIVMFRSLVLRRPPINAHGERILLGNFMGAFLAWGLLTVGSIDLEPGADVCWFTNRTSPQYWIVMTAACWSLVVEAVFVTFIYIKLSKTAKQAAGVLGQEAMKKTTSVVGQLTMRMLLYLGVIVVCGWTAIFTTVFANDHLPVFIGLLTLSLAGIFNAIVWFVFDPTMATITTKILAQASSAGDGTGDHSAMSTGTRLRSRAGSFRAAEAIFGVVSKVNVGSRADRESKILGSALDSSTAAQTQPRKPRSRAGSTVPEGLESAEEATSSLADGKVKTGSGSQAVVSGNPVAAKHAVSTAGRNARRESISQVPFNATDAAPPKTHTLGKKRDRTNSTGAVPGALPAPTDDINVKDLGDLNDMEGIVRQPATVGPASHGNLERRDCKPTPGSTLERRDSKPAPVNLERRDSNRFRRYDDLDDL